MNSNAWDLEGDGSTAGTQIRPLYTVNLNDEEATLKWLNDSFDILCRASRSFIEKARKNMGVYKGLHYQTDVVKTADYRFNYGNSRNKVNKIVVNHMYDLVEQRVSRASRYKPAVYVFPESTDTSDRISAEIAKDWLSYISYVNDFDMLLQQLARSTYIIGEGYIFSGFDAEKGDFHPDWKDEVRLALSEGRPPKVPLVDEQGEQVMIDGIPQFVEKGVRIGEVAFREVLAVHLFPERKPKWEQVNFAFEVEYVDADELRMRYKDKAREITGNDEGKRYDYETLSEVSLGNDVPVVNFYQRATQFMPRGRYIRFTKNAILSSKPYPYDHLPYTRLTDIDPPGHSRGMSFMENGKAINNVINDLTSMIRRNQLLTSHPKWMVPFGSVVKKDTLGNDTSIVEYKGPVPPQLVTPPTTQPEIFNFRSELKEDLQQTSGVYGPSRGEIPKRVDSALALQFLDEQENERANPSIAKFQTLQREVFFKALSLAAKNYHKSDKRLITILGTDKQYLLEDFDPSHLGKPYDIQIQNGSALPQSKSAKVQTLITLHKEFPDLVSNQQVVDMLEFGEAEKFYDAATIAIRSAESEEYAFMLGKVVDPPDPAEDLLTHHQTHLRRYQNKSFKMLKKDIKERFKKHLIGTEYLMFQRARINPSFGQQINALPDFPVFYIPSDDDLKAIGRPPRIPDVMEQQTPPITPAQQQNGSEKIPPPQGRPSLPDQLPDTLESLSAESRDQNGNPIQNTTPPPIENPS